MDSNCIGHQRYRLLVLGSGQVGKTSLIRRYLYQTYNDRYKETVEDIYPRDFHKCGSVLPLDIYDTNFYYPDMRRVSISSADAFLLVFAVDDVNSFKSATELVQEVADRRPGDIDDLPIVLVGNKGDAVDKKIYPETVHVWLKHLTMVKKSIPYYETSAKTGDKTVDIFKSLLDQSGFPRYTKMPADIDRRRRMLQQSRAATMVAPRSPSIAHQVPKKAPPRRQSSQITVRCLSAGRYDRSPDEDDEETTDSTSETIDSEKSIKSNDHSINEKRISRFTKALTLKKLPTIQAQEEQTHANGIDLIAKTSERKRGVLTRHGSLMKKTQAQRLSLKMKRPTIDEPDESDCKIS